MGAIRDLMTSDQVQTIIDAVTSKTKVLFVPKATYNAKISELESTIGELTTRVEALEAYHPQEQTEEGKDDEPMGEG